MKTILTSVCRMLALTLMMVAPMLAQAQEGVDTHIPVNDEPDPNTFVVIIANEH